MSQDTANLLFDAGKQRWLVPREDKIDAKGKGAMQTYWLVLQQEKDCGATHENSSTTEEEDVLTDLSDRRSADTDWSQAETPGGAGRLERAESIARSINGVDDRTRRLIDWNVGMLLRLIKQIIARRNAVAKSASSKSPKPANSSNGKPTSDYAMPLEEVKEIITLPEFDSRAARRQQDPETVDVPPEVESQLREYVTNIAECYNQNSFHNFDHASHVVMSVIKLMSRIVAPNDVLLDVSEHSAKRAGGGSDTDSRSSHHTMRSSNHQMSIKQHKRKMAATLHDHTYGIVSQHKCITYPSLSCKCQKIGY